MGMETHSYPEIVFRIKSFKPVNPLKEYLAHHISASYYPPPLTELKVISFLHFTILTFLRKHTKSNVN